MAGRLDFPGVDFETYFGRWDSGVPYGLTAFDAESVTLADPFASGIAVGRDAFERRHLACTPLPGRHLARRAN